MIELNDIYHIYETTEKTIALRGIDLEFEAGEIIGIFGPNGSGKTTLLKIIRGVLLPTFGEIKFRSNSSRSVSVGYIDQFPFQMIPRNTSTIELVKLFWNDKLSMKFDAIQLLKEINLNNVQTSNVANLSFGELQRLIIIVALIQIPDIILGDEITSSLDNKNIELIMKLISKFSINFNICILIATHDDRIRKFCDKVYNLSEGKVSKVEKDDQEFGLIDRHGAIQFDPQWTIQYNLPNYTFLKYVSDQDLVQVTFKKGNLNAKITDQTKLVYKEISKLTTALEKPIKEIEINNLTKIYRGNNDFMLKIKHLNLRKGLYHLKGVSGSGKTTLLNLLTGIDQDYSGSIIYKSEDEIEPNAIITNFINYVPQFPNLPSALTIREIFELTNPKQLILDELIEFFNLTKLINKRPNELSGGQLRKTSFLAGLLNLKPINVFDEPISFVDSVSANKILRIFDKNILPGIVIIASHNPKIEETISQKIEIQDGAIIIEKDS